MWLTRTRRPAAGKSGVADSVCRRMAVQLARQPSSSSFRLRRRLTPPWRALSVTAALAQQCLQPSAFCGELATYRSSNCLDGRNGPMVRASTALGAGLNALRTAGGDSQDCCWMAGLIISLGIVALSFVDFGTRPSMLVVRPMLERLPPASARPLGR